MQIDMKSVSGIVTLIEFESKEAAEKFYFSDEYQAAKSIRDKGVILTL